MAPGLVPSPRHPGGCRLLLASLTGSERRGNFVHCARPHAIAPSSRRMSSPARIPDWERKGGETSSMAPGLVPSPRHPGGCYDMLLSPSNPCAEHGENGVTRHTTSSTTNSLTGPSPCASMAANHSTDAVLCLFYICLSTIACQYATYLFSFRVFGPRANGGQQIYYTHVYSSSGHYGGQILVLVFYLPIDDV